MKRACTLLALLPLCFGHAASQVRSSPAPEKTVISKASYDLWANTSVMIISRRGTVTLMDGFLTLPQVRPDLVTVSHFHGDHFDPYILGFVSCARSTARPQTDSAPKPVTYLWPLNAKGLVALRLKSLHLCAPRPAVPLRCSRMSR